MSDTSTPGWLKGLIIVFSIASAATFGLWLYRHAEDAALLEQYRLADLERRDLRESVPKVEARIPPLDQSIVARREKIATISQQEDEVITDVNRLVSEIDVIKEAIIKASEEQVKKYAQINTEAKTARKDLGQEEERALNLERGYDEQRLKAREQIELLSRDLETLKREARKANAVADLRNAELDDRIQQLTQQRELNNRELRSDGRLLASRATDGYVVIDRGHQNGLRNGTRFVVYNRRGGKTIVKGSIEVVEVEARLATARVLEEIDANDPLVPGDHIHNPVYNPEAVKVFVIKGDFTRWSAEELARFITEAGGKVEKELTTSSDYLVAGDRAQAALDQASKLGISVLSEAQLIALVRHEPKAAIRSGMTVALCGRFTKVGAGQVGSFIEKSGGKVVGSVRSGVDTLIAGEGADAEIAQARALGITVLDHAQFTYLNDQK